VGGGAVRLELQRGEVLAQRLAVELLLRVDGGQVVVGVGRVRVEVDGLAELANGLVEPAAVGQLDPTGVVLVGERDVVLLSGHGGGRQELYSAENRLRKLHSGCPPLSPSMRRSVLVCTLALAASCAPRVVTPPPPLVPPPESAPQGATPQAPAAPREIVMVAGGDVTLGHHYEEWVDGLRAKGNSGPEVDGYGFFQVKPLFAGADLVVVNLECPFTERGAPIPKNFNFRARPSTVQVLLDAGVKVVSLANNHLMDYGPEGVVDTVATLDGAGIAHFGAGRTLAEARRPAIVEVGGLRVAFLGYLILGPKHPEPEVVWATETKAGGAGHPSDWQLVEAGGEDGAGGRGRGPEGGGPGHSLLPLGTRGQQGTRRLPAPAGTGGGRVRGDGGAGVASPRAARDGAAGTGAGPLLAGELRLRWELEPPGQGLGAGPDAARPERGPRRRAVPAQDRPPPRGPHPAVPVAGGGEGGRAA